MKRKRLRGHSLAVEICRQEGIAYDVVSIRTKALLCRYSIGQSEPLDRCDSNDAELITKMKQEIRREYIEIISGIRKYSDKDYWDFVWKVVRCKWFAGKVDMVLDAIEEIVDGQVSGTPYDPRREGEYCLEGKQFRTILKGTYLDKKTELKSKKNICTDMEISEATFNRRIEDAIVLFGILIWIYANRREREDIEAGIVDKPDYYDEKPCC